jgi:hypothetical protein
MQRTLAFAVIAVVYIASSATAHGAIVVDAIDRGWWDGNGAHDSSNKNTFTGRTSGILHNSYFVFDLTNLSGQATAGTLRLELENYYGNESSETFSVHDVSTPISDLSASGSFQHSIYEDLRSGNTYGSMTVTATDVGSVITISLNAIALSDITSALGGKFAIGITVPAIAAGGGGSRGIRFSEDEEQRVHQLVLETAAVEEVPEPSTITMFALGAIGLTFARFRRRRGCPK